MPYECTAAPSAPSFTETESPSAGTLTETEAPSAEDYSCTHFGEPRCTEGEVVRTTEDGTIRGTEAII